MGKINQVVVNGQNYEVEDKVARNYYPDTKQSAAIAEENSYKIVDKNGNTIAEFKSNSDISILLGRDEENAIIKLTENKVEIGNEKTEINIKGIYESLKYNNNEIGLILKHSCAKIPGDNKNNISSTSANSIILGYNNYIGKANSLIGGTDSNSGDANTLVFGKKLYTGKEGQVIIGEYNYRSLTEYDYYSFIIGGGETSNNSNLVHINKKGAYFKGIGDYNGKAFINSKSLQDIISDFETRISALEKMTKFGTLSIGTNGSKVISVSLNDKIYTTDEEIKNVLKTLSGSYLDKKSNNNYDSKGFVSFINRDVSENEIDYITVQITNTNGFMISFTTIDIETLATSYRNKNISFD